MKQFDNSSIRGTLFAVMIAASIFVPAALRADAPPPSVHGELTVVDGVQVLRVWGDPAERGFAHGYILADDIVKLIEGFLADKNLSGGPTGFEALSSKLKQVMEIPPQYLEELRGIKAGMEAKKGGGITIAGLGRELSLRDLVAMNCVPDSMGIACSSFAAWGDKTPDGKTLSGRNLDWHESRFLREAQLIVAHIPAKDDGKNAWASVTWPGMIICLTGMNEHGVTVAMHDVMNTTPSARKGFTPRGFCLRAAIEGADASNVVDSIEGILKQHICLVGNNIPVTYPCIDGADAAAVFEFDGNKKQNDGVTVRQPDFKRDDKPDFIVATNDYHQREKYGQCRRFETLLKTLDEIEKDDSADKVAKKVDAGFDMLKSVSMDRGYVTYHSVVFEPNDRRMTVSLSTSGSYAPNSIRMTVDLKEILKRPTGERHSNG